jgi:acetyl esterase/lipase
MSGDKRRMITRRGSIIGLGALATTGCTPGEMLNSTVPRTGYVLESDIAYGELPRQRLDYYRPTSPRPDGKTVVFFYGGAWRMGTKKDYLFLGQALAAKGIGVVVADYRLYPAVRFPAFVEDGARATRWAAQRFGANKLFLMGHSAGAHIAMMLATNTRYLREAGVDRLKLRGVIGISGPYDFLPLNSGWLQDVFGDADGPTTQPINFAQAPLPPALLINGTADRLVAASNAERLGAEWRKAGAPVAVKIYSGVDHYFIMGAFADLLRQHAPTFGDTLEFIDAH